MLYKTCTTQAVKEVEASPGTPCIKKDPVTSDLQSPWTKWFAYHCVEPSLGTPWIKNDPVTSDLQCPGTKWFTYHCHCQGRDGGGQVQEGPGRTSRPGWGGCRTGLYRTPGPTGPRGPGSPGASTRRGPRWWWRGWGEGGRTGRDDKCTRGILYRRYRLVLMCTVLMSRRLTTVLFPELAGSLYQETVSDWRDFTVTLPWCSSRRHCGSDP